MIWDQYIPIAVSHGQFDNQAGQQGSAILDFAGMSPQRLIGEAQPIIRDCVNSAAKRLLVNLDGTSLFNLMERWSDITPVPLRGSAPMRLDDSTQAAAPHSTGLLIGVGECAAVDTSGYQKQISDHLGIFITNTLIDSIPDAKSQGEHHFATAGGAHIPTWYRAGPLLELEGVAELFGFHLAKQLQGTSLDLIIPWAEPGIQLAIRLASRLNTFGIEKVGYVVPVKDSLTGGKAEISDLDEATVRGKRVLLLVDVLCAGETIRRLADEVDRCGGYVKAVAGILSFARSQPLAKAIDSIRSQNASRVAEWVRQYQPVLAGPPLFDGVRCLSEVPDQVYPAAGQCRECERGKPYVLLWNPNDHRAAVSSNPDDVESTSRPGKSPVSWSQFWLGAQKARSIGQVEHQVACNHCHDGQVLDISRLRAATELWDEIVKWAILEVETAIRSRAPADIEPIYLVTTPSRGATILAGELVRRFEQHLQGPHIVAKDPHTRITRGKASTLPSGRQCILIDDSIFNTETVTGMLTYAADRCGCQVLGILSILYCARGDDHYKLMKTLEERGISLSAGYVAALQWGEKSRCENHANFEWMKKLSLWPGWSRPLNQWFESSIEPVQKYLERADTSATGDLQIGRMFQHRQREWDLHLIGRFSEEDASKWTQVVAEWHEPEGSFELGPEFAVASTDFGAALNPTSGIRMLRQLLEGQPNPRMTLGISDLINGLPLGLCIQQYEDLVDLFDQYRARLTAAGKTPIDRVSVALFRVLWDVNREKERWLYQILADCNESEHLLYGSVIAAVMLSQQTAGEIKTTIGRLQALGDHRIEAGARRLPKVSGPFVDVALRDLDHYRRYLEREAGGSDNEVAILNCLSDEIVVRSRDVASEEQLAPGKNTIVVDFTSSRLIIGGQRIPTKKRHGFDTLLSLTALVCLHPPGITTGHLRKFLEPRHVIADPSSSARQALLTMRRKLGDSGPFLFQKASGSRHTNPTDKAPWTVTVREGWEWMIVDSPSQNNLVTLRAFVQGLQ